MPIGETRVEFDRDLPRECMEGVEDKGIQDRGRMEMVREGGVNEICYAVCVIKSLAVHTQV